MKTGFISKLLISAFAGLVLTAAVRAEKVPFMFFDEQTETMKESICTDYETLTAEKTTWADGKWYVMDGSFTVNDRVVADGDVYLILKDGCELTAKSGITVAEGSSLTIFGQSEDSGRLNAGPGGGSDQAGIGGDNGSAGDITIHGGFVTATGSGSGKSAGIGGGGDYGGSGNITICGGTVNAVSQRSGAGIGCSGGNRTKLHVTIRGGSVTARSTSVGYGIGGSLGQQEGTISILGGELDASGYFGAVNVGVTLNIADDIVFYRKDNFAPLTKDELLAQCAETNGTISVFTEPKVQTPVDPAYGTRNVRYLAYDGTTGKFAETVHEGCTVVDGNTTQMANGWYVVWDDVKLDDIVGITGDVHLILADNVTFTVNALHVVGGTLFVHAQSEGLTAGRLVAVCGEDYHAGIGGGKGDPVGYVLIYGGRIYAVGGRSGAGIGGGLSSGGSEVNVYGGCVKAVAGGSAAGIGGGNGGNGGNVHIYGGEVFAFGNYESESIGHGRESRNSGSLSVGENMIVTDASNKRRVDISRAGACGSLHICPSAEKEPVTYREYADGAFVKKETKAYYTPYPKCPVLEGAWYVIDGKRTFDGALTVNGDVKLILADGCELYTGGIIVNKGSSLTIYAGEEGTGTLTAVGGKFYAGIGGGDEKECGNIAIHGGNITADGGFNAAGIGGGAAGDGGNVTVYGGEVTATGGEGGAGIGGGISGNGGCVTILGGKVTATGGSDEEGIYGAAGIGSGGRLLQLGEYDSEENGFRPEGTATAGNIIIRGGEVYANGGAMSAGIGGGTGCDAGNVVITGGVVTANGGSYASGIGSGWCECMDEDFYSVTVRVLGGEVKVEGGVVIDNGERSHPAHTFAGEYTDNGNGTHSQKCLYCDEINTEKHSCGADGKCVCGADRFVIDENGVLIAYNGSDEVVDIPDGVTAVGEGVFSGNGTIKEVNIPASAESIGRQAFYRCQSLAKVNFAAGSRLTTIGDMSFTESALTSFTVPKSVKTIGGSSIGGMSTLTQLTFEEGSQLESIGNWAFNNNRLTSLDIPATVKSIGQDAFGYNNFTSVTVHWTKQSDLPQMTGDFSTATYQSAVLNVPMGTADLYANQELWGKFVNIVEPEPDHEHDFTGSYTDNGDGTHTMTCSVCHVSYSVRHTFENGVCVCGLDGGILHYRVCDEDGGEFTVNECGNYRLAYERLTAWEDGAWYVVRGEVTIAGDVKLGGDAHLILTDESALHIGGKVSGSGHLYIYAESAGENAGSFDCGGTLDVGTLSVFGGHVTAQIGIEVTELAMYGGRLSALGVARMSKYGGGDGINAETVKLYGGNIYAEGGTGEAGTDGSTIDTMGRNGGAGLRADTINIYGGKIEAVGGIGGKGGDTDTKGGRGGTGGVGIVTDNIRIVGGEVKAVGGKGGMGGASSVLGISFSGGTGGEGGIGMNLADGVLEGGSLILLGGEGGTGGTGGGFGGEGGIGMAQTGKLTVSGGSLTANGGKGGKPNDASGSFGGDGGIGMTLTEMEVTGGIVSVFGGNGCDGTSGNIGGHGGNGAYAVEYGILTVADGVVTATGGEGGEGGYGTNYGVYADNGTDGVCVRKKTDGVLTGYVTVKNDESARYVSLPDGESAEAYRFAMIVKENDISIAVDVAEGVYTVTAVGTDEGLAVVALYNKFGRMTDVKIFDLSEGEDPVGETAGAALIRAFLLSDTFEPLCGAAEKEIGQTNKIS